MRVGRYLGGSRRVERGELVELRVDAVPSGSGVGQRLEREGGGEEEVG